VAEARAHSAMAEDDGGPTFKKCTA